MNKFDRRSAWLMLGMLLLPCLVCASDFLQAEPIQLEFSGYRFGQNPSANMVCKSGYCKSQAPGGDGLVDVPFSIYETPGALTTIAGLSVVNPRYTFWEDHLYRVSFQVDCLLLDSEECLDDITKALDRDYSLTPLATSDSQQFITGGRVHLREFLTDSGAFLKIRATMFEHAWQMPLVDILDRGMADRVGTSLSPNYKPRNLPLPRALSTP